MNIASLIQTMMTVLDSARVPLTPIPGILLACTCARRPGLSSLLMAAKIFTEMPQNEYDDIIKKFVYNVVEKIKQNIHDDGVCLMVIPPKALKFKLVGGNLGGPIVFTESPVTEDKKLTNTTFIYVWGIIR